MRRHAKLTPQARAKDRDWWRGAVIYQIYPRSYQDTNADGVGDLNGITQRLDHIADLGVDAVWISPFFTSPMRDFGYDVSNYCDVDPMFGSLADFDALVARAHDLGLRVMIDLVLSHTSIAHPWFRESRETRTNARANWYVWADPKPDGSPPTNWLSIFGGSAWHWEGRREQYYLHNFLNSQPDLNFHEPAVQEALLDVARFWLERGVDGFRLDTINFYFHDENLRDNPALPPKQRNANIAPSVNPYNHQLHMFDKNQPENLAFLRRLRRVMDPYNAAAVGEVGDAQRGLEILGQYTAGNDKMQMCYAFEFLAKDRLTPDRIADTFAQLDTSAPDGWACWALSNHDVMRHVSRWMLPPAGAIAYATLLTCLRGSICLYQGEELGLPEADVAYEDLQATPTGSSSGPSSRAATDAARRWSGSSVEPQRRLYRGASPGFRSPTEHLGRVGLDRARSAIPCSATTCTITAGVIAAAPTSPSGARPAGAMTGMRAVGRGDLSLHCARMTTRTIFCAFNLGERDDLSRRCRPRPSGRQIAPEALERAGPSRTRGRSCCAARGRPAS